MNVEASLLDLIRADQLTPEIQKVIYDRADEFQDPAEIRKAGEKLQELYKDIGQLAMYFWFEEPSSRTVGSFDSARELLGLGRLGETNAKIASSTAKGEGLRDSMRTAKGHLKKFGGAIIVIRHPQIGSAAQAAVIHDFPVINAGDGQNEHPTQALLDMYTIRQKKGKTSGLTIAMGGDPLYSRTIHSLAEVASREQDNELLFIGGKGLWVGDDTKKMLTKRQVPFEETTDIKALRHADVVYWTRMQKERLPQPPDLYRHPIRHLRIERENDHIWNEYVEKYALNEQALEVIKHDAIIMHPLPRGPEIPESIDTDERAVYWDQADNAVPVRVALTELVLTNYIQTKCENTA